MRAAPRLGPRRREAAGLALLEEERARGGGCLDQLDASRHVTLVSPLAISAFEFNVVQVSHLEPNGHCLDQTLEWVPMSKADIAYRRLDRSNCPQAMTPRPSFTLMARIAFKFEYTKKERAG